MIQLRTNLSILLLAITVLLSGCGKAGGTSSSGVIVSATAFSDGSRELASLLLQNSYDIIRGPSDFKFCSTKLKLKNSAGSAVGGADSLEIVMGLIDVGSGAAEKTLGTVAIPVDFSLGKLELELHKDKDKCSEAEYSVLYNGQEISKDLEFKFKFDPPVTVNQGDTLKLVFTAITTAMKSAQTAGAFNTESIGNYLKTTTEGAGSK